MLEDAAGKGAQSDYDDAIVDSNAIDPYDDAGQPIPVTIPIALVEGVKVVYTTRLGGVSTGGYASCNLGGKGGDDLEHVMSNRAAVAKVVGAPLALVSQVHSGKAVDVDELMGVGAVGEVEAGSAATYTVGENKGRVVMSAVEADGQVSSRTGVALGMFAADCLPVLMADPEVGVIAAAHCGRRGLERGILGSTVRMMVGKGAKPERIVATLGPCICGDCYEVGQEIADAFDARFPGTFTLTRFGGPGIDIAAAALQELDAAGVLPANIISSTSRVAAATQYLANDEELLRLHQADAVPCVDGAGEAGSRDGCVEGGNAHGHKAYAADGTDDGFISSVHHALCTLENPLWYSHRRSTLTHKAHEGRMLALIMRE